MGKISKTTWINILLLVVFTLGFILRQNYEFLIYAVTLAVLVWFVEATDKIFNYPTVAKYGFNLWLLAHLSGGYFFFSGVRLYDIVLINLIGAPFDILKYDQVIHTFCYVVITLFMYSIVMKIVDKKANKFVIYLVIVLAGSSLGAVNEIIEFIAVILFDAGEAVGGYYNTALDLVFNFVGALIAIAIASKLPKSKDKK